MIKVNVNDNGYLSVTKPTIIDFFDIYNVDHLAAYDYFCNNGNWPEGFLPDNLGIPPSLWQVNLVGRMANAYISAAITGKIEGISSLDEY